MVYGGKGRTRSRNSYGRRSQNSREEGANIGGKLAASLWVLFLAVMLRVLFPSQVEAAKDKVVSLVTGEGDYQGAIAVMGEAVRGERAFSDAVAAAYDMAFKGDSGETETLNDEGDSNDTSVPASVSDSMDDIEPLPDNVSTSAQPGILGIIPVNGTVTSSFGYRDDPNDGQRRFHYGTDLGAEAGADVGSFLDGTVYAAGDSSTYGLYLIVDHGEGVQTLYAHLSEISVNEGDEVVKGQKLGAVGDTGNATSPCLHFELKKDGIYLDPEDYMA